MKKYNYNSISQLEKLIKYYKIEIDDLLKKTDDASIEEIKTIKNYINNIKEELKDHSTFNIFNATYFIEQVLSLFEKEMYLSSVFTFSNENDYFYENEGIKGNKSELIGLIANPYVTDDITAIYNKQNFKTKTSKEFMLKYNQLIDKDNQISITGNPVSYTYCFLDFGNIQIKKELLKQRFPYIVDVVIDLIDFRIQNPNMNETEIIEKVLNQIKYKYKELNENGYCNIKKNNNICIK